MMNKEGWTISKLGDLCEIYQPKTISTSDLCENGKYLVYGANGVIGRYNEYNHKDKEVLLCCRGATCGAINVSEEFSWINGNAMVIRPIDGRISKLFLRYLLTSLDYSKIITGAAQPQITRTTLSPTIIKFPKSTEEQAQIVEYLDNLFTNIDKTKKKAEHQIAEAEKLFQSALNEKLQMRDGWKKMAIDELFSSIKNGANIKQSKGASGIPITRIETLSNGVFNIDRLGYADVFDNKYETYYLNDGDILMSHINSLEYVGRSVVYHNYCNEPLIHGMNLLRLIPNGINSDYCCYYFKSKSFRSDILSITHKSVNQASFNITNLKTLFIPIPPLSDQQSIVNDLDDISTKTTQIISKCQQIIKDCDTLKQAILKQIFE